MPKYFRSQREYEHYHGLPFMSPPPFMPIYMTPQQMHQHQQQSFMANNMARQYFSPYILGQPNQPSGLTNQGPFQIRHNVPRVPAVAMNAADMSLGDVSAILPAPQAAVLAHTTEPFGSEDPFLKIQQELANDSFSLDLLQKKLAEEEALKEKNNPQQMMVSAPQSHYLHPIAAPMTQQAINEELLIQLGEQ